MLNIVAVIPNILSYVFGKWYN